MTQCISAITVTLLGLEVTVLFSFCQSMWGLPSFPPPPPLPPSPPSPTPTSTEFWLVSSLRHFTLLISAAVFSVTWVGVLLLANESCGCVEFRTVSCTSRNEVEMVSGVFESAVVSGDWCALWRGVLEPDEVSSISITSATLTEGGPGELTVCALVPAAVAGGHFKHNVSRQIRFFGGSPLTPSTHSALPTSEVEEIGVNFNRF